jgi:hypothetical protein
MNATYCTITDYFYSPKALVLYESLAAVVGSTDFNFFVLCLDEHAERAVAGLRIDNLQPISASQIPELATVNERPIFEFACAAKPFLLEFLLEQKRLPKVCYFDSDMWFLSDPSFMFQHLDSYDILLKPSLTEADAVRKDWQWAAYSAKYTGYYNGGFVGVNFHALAFVRWWKQMCVKSTSHDFRAFTVGDQRYLDFVPGCFEKVLLLRHKGCNFKHWMVKNGGVKRTNGKLFVDGEEVVFFHFSQNLGNITEYDSLVHPEVIDYIARLKEARRILGAPYFSSQGHGHNQNVANGTNVESGLCHRILRYLEIRVRLLLPGALTSGRLKKSLKLSLVRKLARFCLSLGRSKALLEQLEITHPISPETVGEIYRYASKTSGSTVILGTMDAVPAIGSVLAQSKTIVIDSFEARYFSEGKLFVNPKLTIFNQNLAKLKLGEKVTLLRHDPADATALGDSDSPIALLVIDCTFGNEAVVEYLTRWVDFVSQDGVILCSLPQDFDARILESLNSKITTRFSKILRKLRAYDRQALVYRKIGKHRQLPAGRQQREEIPIAESA